MNQARLKSIIDKYLLGTATEKECELIDRWYQLEEHEKKRPTNHDDDLQLRLLTKINQEILSNTPQRKKKNIKFLTLLKVAASLFLIGITAFCFFNKDNQIKEEWTAVATKRGELRAFRFADSSMVWLNANSKLSYNDKFNDKKREIWLEGEAFFDIKHNPSKPFIIHTNKLTTTVLGTAFNINSYNISNEVVITVNRGKVGLTTPNKSVSTFLTANQQGVYAVGKLTIQKSEVNAENAKAWINGDFVFKEMSFLEIAERLQRRFDVNITFSSKKLEKCLLSASFRKGATLEEILIILNEIDDCKFTKNNETNKYLISGKGCK